MTEIELLQLLNWKLDLLLHPELRNELALRSNSGIFALIKIGTGAVFQHAPTGEFFRVGTVLRNPDGALGTLAEDGTWSWEPGPFRNLQKKQEE
mgnify:CR=1 FL=1